MASSESEQGKIQRVLASFRKRQSQPDLNVFNFTTFEDVKDAIENIQKEQASKKGLRNLQRVKPFLKALEQYAGVLEVFIQVKPDALALIWGPIKLCLQIASKVNEAFDALLDAYEKIGMSLPVLSAVDALFCSHPHVKQVLIDTFEDILDFHKRAIVFFRHGTWKLAFKLTYHPFSEMFEDILKKLSRSRELLLQSAHIAHFQESQEARRDISRDFQVLLEEQQHTKRLAVMDRLSTESTWKTRHREIRELRSKIPQTTRWIYKEPAMISWLEGSGPRSRILWLRGIPGAGKTVIFNSIIHEICDNQSDVQVVYFYCKNNDPLRSSAAEIAKGLILQVLEQDPNCLDFIYESILKNGPRDSSIYVPMLTEILMTHDSLYVGLDGLDECPEQDRKILSNLIMTISAADSAQSGVRTLVTSRKEKDLEKGLCSAAILDIKPRNLEYDIAAYVRMEVSQLSRTFSLSSEREESVGKEICTRPQGMFLLARLIMDNLSDQDTLEDLNEELRSEILPHGIDEAYSRMLVRIGKAHPTDRVPEKRLARANLVLELITTAKRGLYVHEIQGALAISIKEQNIDFEGRHTVLPLDDLCGPIVQIHQDGLVDMVHPTAKDYLMQHHSGYYIKALAAEEKLTSLCTSYLSFDCFAPVLTEEKLQDCVLRGDFALQEYAICYWLHHLKRFLHRSDSDFLISSETVSALKLLSECHAKHSKVPPDSQELYQRSSDMQIAYVIPRLIETYETIETIRENDTELQEQIPYLLRRINEARSRIEARISPGVDLERMVKFYGKTPFRCPVIRCPYFAAGFKTFEDREKHYKAHQRSFMCIYESCDYSAIGLPSKPALELHFKLCHDDISDGPKFPCVKAHPVGKLLTDAIDANDPLAVTALATELASLPEEERPKGFVLHALQLRHREIAISLLDLIGTSSEINYVEKSKSARSAILKVCETGDEEILTLLLDRGGDPNMGFPETDSNPICMALEHRCFSIARTLLSHPHFEISRTRKTVYHQNGPLVLASKYGSLDILSHILDAESEYYKGPQGRAYKSAMIFFKRAMRSAIKEGEAESAKLLVRWALENESAQLLPSIARKIRGLDVAKIVEVLSEEVPEVKDNGGTRDNILQAMAYKGDVTNVLRLLDLGADIDNDASTYGTPLMAAASNGKLDVVNLLVDRGANIMAVEKLQSGNGPNALDIAAVSSQEEIVTTLLARGVDFQPHYIHEYVRGLNIGKCYSLQGVSRTGTSPMIARLLLEHGAEVDAASASRCYRSPLQLAAEYGHDTILRTLLEYQPNVNFRARHKGFDQSPLHLAAQGGHTTCVRVLLSAKGIDVNTHHMVNNGHTPLHTAIKTRNLEIVELLIEHGADVNAIDDRGNTSFHMASENGDHKLVELLVKSGASETAGLVLAAQCNNSLAVERVLQCMAERRLHKSANSQAFEDTCKSLQVAASKGHEKIVRLLLGFIDKDIDSYGHYSAAVSNTLEEAVEKVTETQASATSSEGPAKSYWDIYSLLVRLKNRLMVNRGTLLGQQA